VRKSSFKTLKRKKYLNKPSKKNKRIIVIAIFLLLLVSFFVIRLYKLQIVNSEKYIKQLDSMRLKRSYVPAPRGNISDRNGVLLAHTLVKRFVDISETFKGVYGSKRNSLIEELSDICGISVLSVMDYISEGNDIPLRLDVSFDNPEISLDYKFERVYDFNGSMSHIVGYVNKELKGIAGIENTFDNWLKGQDGLFHTEVDSVTRKLRNYWIKKPQAGNDLSLSVDSELTNFIDGILSEIENNSVVIVTNPANGEILSMVSHPYFESGEMVGYMPQEKWEELIEDPGKVFLNRAIQDSYNPGSLIKPFVSLCALSRSSEEVQKEVINRIICNGKFIIESSNGDDYVYHDWKRDGHGITNFFTSILGSCNIYFYELGIRLGIDYMKEIADQVNLTEKSGVELPGEIKGIFPDKNWKKNFIGERWYLGDTVLSSIGQGYVSITPVELIKMIEFIGNEGRVCKSTLLKNKQSKAELLIDLPDSHWNYLKTAMNGVINNPNGTAYNVFKDSAYSKDLIGKTGTAETGVENIYNSWFTCLYPQNNPEIAILVFVEKGGYGSSTAAPIGKRILDYYMEGKTE